MYKYILIAMIVSILPLEPIEPAIRRSTIGSEPNYLPCSNCVEFNPATGTGNIPRHFIGPNWITNPDNHRTKMLSGYKLSVSTQILISNKSDVWHIDPECELTKPVPETLSAGEYVIIRTVAGCVYAGTLKNREGKEVTLTEARMIVYSDWPMAMAEMATKGTIQADRCKLSDSVTEITLTEVTKVLYSSAGVKEKLQSVENGS